MGSYLLSELLFFLAFLSVIWIIGLIDMQLGSMFNSAMKDSAIAGYQAKKNEKGLFAFFTLCLYLLFNGQLIFPIRGLMVSLIFIFLFILFI